MQVSLSSECYIKCCFFGGGGIGGVGTVFFGVGGLGFLRGSGEELDGLERNPYGKAKTNK